MARRTFIKAYGDIVGGAGNDVSVSIGPEVSKNPSTLKLTSKDVCHGKRRAVEVKPIEVKQVPKCPLQVAHLQRKALKEGAGERFKFVKIDGDGGAAQVNAPQQSKTVPQTAYKSRSFMSSVDLGPRRKPQKHINHRPKPPPPVRTLPKVPEKGKMFLPKGIDRTDKPYVVPKFMPSYREMMSPKPKPDPLVSILEPTPPSMQKWAVEWNAEPKHISIAELAEDIIRETAEKSLPGNTLSTNGPSPCVHPGSTEHDGQSIREQTQGHSWTVQSSTKTIAKNKAPDHGPWVGQSVTETVAKNKAPNHGPKPWAGQSVTETIAKNKAPDHGQKPHAGQSLAGTVAKTKAPGHGQKPPWTNLGIPENHELITPEPKRNLGQPLTDWSPPRFNSIKHLGGSEYSFKDAIAQSGHSPNAKDKPKFTTITENSVYFDTEEQNFHKWFKERMSAAVQSVVDDQLRKVGNKQNQATLNKNPVSTVQPNLRGQNVESGHPAKKNYNDSSVPEMIPPADDQPPMLNNVTVEHEPNSSFCHWLKLRGHPVVKKEPENQGHSEKILQKHPKFPWSVSYALRKSVVQRAIPKKLATSKNSKSQKSIPRNEVFLQERTSNVDIKPGRPKSPKPGKPRRMSSRTSLRGVRKSVKSETKLSAKRSVNKMAKAKLPRHAASIESVYPSLFGRGWNVNSEMDHVNNMRQIGTKPTKLQGQQMKYWESKFVGKSRSNQGRHPSAQTAGSSNKTVHNWYRSGKSTERLKSVFSGTLAEHSENTRFSSIEETSIPFKLGTRYKDQVMGFANDFDVDGFLCKEESTEKELLDAAENCKTLGNPEDVPGNVMKAKELIQFKRSANIQGIDVDVKQREERKLDEGDLVLAFGEDPGLEDLQWSEFIGPRTGLDADADLTRMLASQARQISFEHSSCL